MDSATISTLVRDYERHLVRRTRSPNTLRTYRYASDEFTAHLNRYGVTTPAELGREHIEGWMDSLIDRGLKPGTRGVMAGWLRGFLQWASMRTDTLQPNLWMSVGKVTVPPRLARPLEPGDVRKLIAYFNFMREPKAIDRRDKALFLTLFTTGLRISEVLQQRRRDARRLTVVRQKGSKPRTLEIHPLVQRAVDEYLAARSDDHPALWVTYKSNSPVSELEPAGVRELFRKVAKRAGVPIFTTHQLRHTTASQLFDEGVPEGVIADYLGHGDLDSVRGYIDIRNRRREAMAAMGHILEASSGKADSMLERLAADLEDLIRGAESGEVGVDDNIVGHARALAAALRARGSADHGGANQAV